MPGTGLVWGCEATRGQRKIRNGVLGEEMGSRRGLCGWGVLRPAFHRGAELRAAERCALCASMSQKLPAARHQGEVLQRNSCLELGVDGNAVLRPASRRCGDRSPRCHAAGRWPGTAVCLSLLSCRWFPCPSEPVLCVLQSS